MIEVLGRRSIRVKFEETIEACVVLSFEFPQLAANVTEYLQNPKIAAQIFESKIELDCLPST
jgi:hypothetical protein